MFEMMCNVINIFGIKISLQMVYTFYHLTLQGGSEKTRCCCTSHY